MTLETEIVKTVTSPTYLIYLGTDVPFYYSSRGDVNWGGQVWSGAGVEVRNISSRPGGSQSAELRFPNHDKSLSAVVLNERVVNKACQIWKFYGSGFADTDGLLVFNGIMDEVPEIGEYVTIRAQSESVFDQYSPRLVCGPPTMNFIPATNTQILWDGSLYTLERK